jgi:hypothetical protein
MAKAPTKPTPVIYTWPRDILSLLREICGSRQQGERWLVGLIAAKRMRLQLTDPVPPDEDLENFWQGEPGFADFPKIDFEECTATKMDVYGIPGAMGPVPIIVQFKIVREDIVNAAIEDGLIVPTPTTASQSEDAQSVATETKSAQAVKIDANMVFLKDQYALMEKAGGGYLKGNRECSKPAIAGKLHKRLENAARTDAKLKVWEPRYIEQKMNEHEVW